MPTHGGQMAFVGGHRRSDEANPWDVAQREFEEETNIGRKNVEFLGFLPIVFTARLRPIVPVMGKLLISTDEFFKYVKSNGEWDDVIAYPWKELIDEDSWEFAWRNGFTQTPVLFHPIRRNTFIPLNNDIHTHLLWGATASMVWDFLRLYYRP